MVKAAVPPMIPSLQILEYFGFSNTEQVELGLESAGHQTYILKPSLINRNNRVSVKPDSISFIVKNESQIFTDFYDPDQKIYHILYNKCLSKEVALEYGNAEMANNLPSFKTFEDQIFNTLNNKSVTKIIFDMRYNSGGNSAQGTSLIEKLAKFLDANPTLKTYVVLGRATFSSAILNALDFKRLTNAIFIGEETSGKLNHFGEIKSFQLPTSKLVITYSTNYFKMADEDVNTLAPDIPIETSFSDLMRGIDPVYEWVKRQ
jgi:hypothetical protein